MRVYARHMHVCVWRPGVRNTHETHALQSCAQTRLPEVMNLLPNELSHVTQNPQDVYNALFSQDTKVILPYALCVFVAVATTML